MSDVDSVRDMGLLIGRGVLLSGLMVLVTLPALLVLLDKPLQVLTFKKKKKEEKI
jgi:predicted RND superfamily exporter protein